jgi:hypothetical protein
MFEMKSFNQKGESEVGGIIGLIVVGLLIWGAYSIFFKPDKWQIISSNASDSYATGEYSSSEACLEDLHSGNYPNGECGSNCKPRETANVGTLYTCKETLD